MTLADATSLAAAHFEAHDPRADQAALSKLAAWCEQFSPTVGIEQPDSLSLDVTGLGALFHGEESLAHEVARSFRRLGYQVRVAIADTLGAAWALAHFGQKSPVVAPPERTIAALEELPIAALRLNDAAAILTELGVERIGQLLSIPRDALASRFDPQMLLRLHQAMGLAPEVIVPHRPPPEISIERQLEFPTDNRQAVDAVLDPLMAEVAKVLKERQEGALRLACQLRCEEGELIEVLVGLCRASARAQHLLEMTRLQLERVSLPGPLVAVRLSVLLTAPLQTWQQELFGSSRHERRRQASLLVDRLSNRLGHSSVVRAVPQADAQPEMAFRYESLAGMRPRKNTPQRWKLLPRPLRLEHEPAPLAVLSVAPDGPPIQFNFHGPHQVAQAWGPERIQTGWWRGRYVQRDYYRIETAAGKRFWLFRRLSDAKWFLHGVFD
jgi:protein ImuB